MIRQRKFVCVSGSRCRDCKAEIKRIALTDRVTYRENDPPFRHDCRSCGSVWGPYVKAHSSEEIEMPPVEAFDFELFEALSSTKCTGCGKPICMVGTFGSFGDSVPEGTLIEGAAYCLDCAEKTPRIIEAFRK
jgi:hypothetical protein